MTLTVQGADQLSVRRSAAWPPCFFSALRCNYVIKAGESGGSGGGGVDMW